MSITQHFPKPGAQDTRAELAKPATPSQPRSPKRSPSPWSTRRRRNAWLILVLFGVIIVLVLSNGLDIQKGEPNITQSAISPTTSTNTQPTTTAIMAIGRFREYPLPLPDTQMMRPAIDHQGRIWFTEVDKIGILRP